jgi:L-threonylcarbamoyladenylate synthase
VLAAGEACVIPTDTVYGVAASVAAANQLFELKGRPREKALPVLGSDPLSLEGVVLFDDRAHHLARRFWPGALTIVLPRAPGFDADLGGDGTTIAVRVPAHRIALELLRLSGPLAVTSANRSGQAPATTAALAAEQLPGVHVLDGGRCDGEPSTIVDLTTLRVLREGALPAATVLGELGS